jgi:hypothetical protein
LCFPTHPRRPSYHNARAESNRTKKRYRAEGKGRGTERTRRSPRNPAAGEKSSVSHNLPLFPPFVILSSSQPKTLPVAASKCDSNLWATVQQKQQPSEPRLRARHGLPRGRCQINIRLELTNHEAVLRGNSGWVTGDTGGIPEFSWEAHVVRSWIVIGLACRFRKGGMRAWRDHCASPFPRTKPTLITIQDLTPVLVTFWFFIIPPWWFNRGPHGEETA